MRDQVVDLGRGDVILYFRPTTVTLITFLFLTKYTIIPFQNKMVKTCETLTAHKLDTLASWGMGIAWAGEGKQSYEK